MADDSDRRSWSDISQRLQNLRNLLTSEGHLADNHRALEALEREMDHMSADYAAAATRDRRRRDFDTHTQDHEASPVFDLPPQTHTPGSSGLVRSRRRAVRPSERLQRSQRERLGQNARTPLPDIQTPTARLSPSSPAQSTSDRGERLRSKRRKLDDGTYDEEPQTFRYGFEGQVIPGQLRMQIASCDGGEYSDPTAPINNYPQNVLLDDNSVYCTKSNKCNMLLKHVGGMPFTLTKIIVKAPRAGFDAPIQEGLIFISMHDDGLAEKTSPYDVRWSPRSYRHSRYRGGNGSQPPSQEYLNSTRSPLRSNDRSRDVSGQTDQDEPSELDTNLVPGFGVSVADPSDEEDAGEVPTSPRPWHEDDYSFRSYVDRYRPVYLGVPTNGRNDNLSATSSDSDGEAGPVTDSWLSREREQYQRQQLEDEMEHQNRLLDRMRAQQIRDNDEVFGRRSRQGDQNDDDPWRFDDARRPSSSLSVARNPPGVLPPSLSYPSDRRSTAEPNLEDCISSKLPRGDGPGTSAAGSDGLKPHARFFISRSKSSTAIKFDPPVSGRYVFVKLWAQCPKTNIDIQSILIYGYGGPTFFPCVELR